MKTIIIFASVIIICTFSLTCIHNYETDAMAVHIGEEVVIGEDTLIIVSFSTFTDEYFLSDGMVISKDLIDNLNETKD